MVFGLFYRKQLRTPSPSIADSKKLSPAPIPPPTPSPQPQLQDTTPLHALILSVPPQTLHTYALSHLDPSAPPPSPTTITCLTSFFSTLSPPTHLHCVRCHKFFFEIENDDRSCLIGHDDDSAEVERIGWASGVAPARYETLWGCCGKNVEGDGDMGPPDGWCYEGKHTVSFHLLSTYSVYVSCVDHGGHKTDHKRARFRADSTPHDDKLVPCALLRCHQNSPSSSSLSELEPESIPDEKPRGRKRRVKPRELSAESERVPTSAKSEGVDEETSVMAKKSIKASMKSRSRRKPKDSTEDTPMDVSDDHTSVTQSKPDSKATMAITKRKAKSRSSLPKSTAGAKPNSTASVAAKQPKTTSAKAKQSHARPASRSSSVTGSRKRSESCHMMSEGDGSNPVDVVKKKKRKLV